MLVVCAGPAYQLPHGAVPRAPQFRMPSAPSASFFDDLKKGLEAGMSSPSSSPSEPTTSIFDELKQSIGNALNPVPPTDEERIAQRIQAGEGVLWSVDGSRAWRSKNGMPQDEISLEEGKRIALELSIALPPEVEAADY